VLSTAGALTAGWLSQAVMRLSTVMEKGMENQQNQLSLVGGMEECGGDIAKDSDKQQFSIS